MRRSKWTMDDTRGTLQLAGIFAVICAVLGLVHGEGLLIGAFGGALTIGMAMGVGFRVSLL